MQSRRTAFVALRRLALGDFYPASRHIQPWIKPTIRPFSFSAVRFEKSEPSPSVQWTPVTDKKSHAPRPRRSNGQPAYEMTFTCKPCSTRSTHLISKQGYHSGSVLVTCPECKNRHVISDHLGIFSNKATTIEDLMREKGQLVKKGSLSEDGDLEFWEDGTITSRSSDADSAEAK